MGCGACASCGMGKVNALNGRCPLQIRHQRELRICNGHRPMKAMRLCGLSSRPRCTACRSDPQHAVCNPTVCTCAACRSDPQYTVRNEALHVWKTVVVNTPKTLLQILPVLMENIIAALASQSEDRQVRGKGGGEGLPLRHHNISWTDCHLNTSEAADDRK